MTGKAFLDLLRCPDCGGIIEGSERDIGCGDCGRNFPVGDHGIVSLMPKSPPELPPAYHTPEHQRARELLADSLSYFTDDNAVFSAIHASSHRRIARWRREAGKSGWICDLGCGEGYHWRYSGPDRSQLIGVDSSMENLETLRQRFPDGHLVQASAARLPFKDGAFNEITSVYALEHIYHLAEAVAEIDRTLSENRRCYVGLPCEGGLAWNLGRKLTSERTLSRRYGVDYAKFMKLEHCNSAARVMTALRTRFTVDRVALFPFGFLPLISVNLTVTIAMTKR